MKGTVFLPGQYNVICDRCGRKLKNTQVRMEWDNLLVCNKCWEPRQPQDLLRAIPDRQTPPIVRPEAADQFVEGNDE